MADEKGQHQHKKNTCSFCSRSGEIIEVDGNNQFIKVKFTVRGKELIKSIQLCGLQIPRISKAKQKPQAEEGAEPVKVADNAKIDAGAREVEAYLKHYLHKKVYVKAVIDELNDWIVDKETFATPSFVWIHRALWFDLFLNSELLYRGLAKTDKKTLTQYTHKYVKAMERGEEFAKKMLRGPVYTKESIAEGEKRWKFYRTVTISFLIGLLTSLVFMFGYFIPR